MKIVAFLQNMWVRNPARVRRMLDRDTTGKLRERVLAHALFAGCLTGRRLRAGLGEELCDSIVWEEASPVIADNPQDYHAPDPEHIRRVLAKHQPDLVLCFTKRGEQEILAACDCQVISAPHPAARSADVTEHLERVRLAIETMMLMRNAAVNA